MHTISLFRHGIISFVKSTKNFSNTPIIGLTVFSFFNFVNLWNLKPHFSPFLDIFCPVINCKFDLKKMLSKAWYQEFFLISRFFFFLNPARNSAQKKSLISKKSPCYQDIFRQNRPIFDIKRYIVISVR